MKHDFIKLENKDLPPEELGKEHGYTFSESLIGYAHIKYGRPKDIVDIIS